MKSKIEEMSDNELTDSIDDIIGYVCWSSRYSRINNENYLYSVYNKIRNSYGLEKEFDEAIMVYTDSTYQGFGSVTARTTLEVALIVLRTDKAFNPDKYSSRRGN